VPSAAAKNPDGTMTYSLDVDPQDTVVPETLTVAVTWPTGWTPSSALPPGWHATGETGARYAGPVTQALSFQIPLTKG
jgi:hypothetical protein